MSMVKRQSQGGTPAQTFPALQREKQQPQALLLRKPLLLRQPAFKLQGLPRQRKTRDQRRQRAAGRKWGMGSGGA